MKSQPHIARPLIRRRHPPLQVSTRPKKEPTRLFVMCRFLMQELYIRKAEGAQEEPHAYEKNLFVSYPCATCNVPARAKVVQHSATDMNVVLWSKFRVK